MAPKIKIGAGRYQQTYDSRDDGGKRSGGGLNWGKLGAAPKFYKPSLDTLNKFNVIPFQIKSKLHPEVMAGRMSVGDYDFVLDFWVHRKIGPDEVDVLCPKNTYGKKCPICDERGRLYDANQEDAAKDIKPTRRVLFNVQPITREGAGDLQVFDVSHWLFMKELSEEANAMANGNGVINYADLDDGKIVAFRCTEEKTGNQKSMKFKSFKFIDREAEVDAELVEKAVSFDDLLVLHTPDELEAILYGKPTAEDTESAPRQTAPKQETQAASREESDEDVAARVGAELAKDDKPTESKKAAPKAEAPTGTQCPHAHAWGSADEHNECGRCKLWDACNAAGRG